MSHQWLLQEQDLFETIRFMKVNINQVLVY